MGGRILFEGRDMSKMSADELRKIRGGRMAMVYQEVTRQAQVLAFADDFWLLFVLFCGTLLLLPLLERVRTGPATVRHAGADDAPAPVHVE